MQVHIIIYIRDPACARWYTYTGINIILLTEPTYKMGSYNKCIKQKKPEKSRMKSLASLLVSLSQNTTHKPKTNLNKLT